MVSPKIDFYFIFKLQFFENLPKIFLKRRLRRRNLGASPPKVCPPTSKYWGGGKKCPSANIGGASPPAPPNSASLGGQTRFSKISLYLVLKGRKNFLAPSAPPKHSNYSLFYPFYTFLNDMISIKPYSSQITENRVIFCRKFTIVRLIYGYYNLPKENR